jgi:hypothetical protein
MQGTEQSGGGEVEWWGEILNGNEQAGFGGGGNGNRGLLGTSSIIHCLKETIPVNRQKASRV